MGSIDLVISGHRAVDGETGQTGPQVAWKLGFNFFGNVIRYSIDVDNKMLHATRLIEIQGLYNILEEIECPLPALIAIDPSYKEHYTTVSQRLKYVRLQRNAMKKVENYKQYLKVWTAKDLNVEMKNVGLPGSPTIVYKVEKVPRAKASRHTKVIDISKDNELNDLGKKLVEMLNSK
jgi:electron transfer flavoprotein beta subunit